MVVSWWGLAFQNSPPKTEHHFLWSSVTSDWIKNSTLGDNSLTRKDFALAFHMRSCNPLLMIWWLWERSRGNCCSLLKWICWIICSPFMLSGVFMDKDCSRTNKKFIYFLYESMTLLQRTAHEFNTARGGNLWEDKLQRELCIANCVLERNWSDVHTLSN